MQFYITDVLRGSDKGSYRDNTECKTIENTVKME